MNPHRGISSELIERLNAAVAAQPVTLRPHSSVAQCVLRYLVSWARRRDGGWYATETVGQIALGVGCSKRGVSNALDVLTSAGICETINRGGGRGKGARGSTRRLHLDDVENARMASLTEERTECASSLHEFRHHLHEFRRSLAPVLPETDASNPAEFRRPDRWPDDSDLDAAPPPIGETIRAIRAKVGNVGSSWLDESALESMGELRRRRETAAELDEAKTAAPADPWAGYY